MPTLAPADRIQLEILYHDLQDQFAEEITSGDPETALDLLDRRLLPLRALLRQDREAWLTTTL